jgi:hypothetical protein
MILVWQFLSISQASRFTHSGVDGLSINPLRLGRHASLTELFIDAIWTDLFAWIKGHAIP